MASDADVSSEHLQATDRAEPEHGQGAPPLLEARDLVVVRGQRRVLEIERFTVNEHETVAVVGPNGAGKSTLLLTIASLVRPQQGTLALHGTTITRRRALGFRRRIGLVLADPLLLDTSVYNNAAAGLRFRGIRGRSARRSVDEWLDRLGILALRDRPARHLSSGEAQRVSLARALVLDPEILLLDEPFASVDVAARAQLLDDTERLLSETSIGCVLVTHDIDEAGRLGTQMAVIVKGRLRQYATPERVLTTPIDAEVAAFVGVENRLPGHVVTAQDEGLALVEVGGHRIEAVSSIRAGRPVLCCVRPEAVTLRTVGRLSPTTPLTSARNHLQGRVTRIAPRGPLVHVMIDCGPTLVASITQLSVVELGLREGDLVEATFKASAVHLIALPH